MYVKVRSVDGTANAVITLSKTASVRELKVLVEKSLNVSPERQRLFFGGKQLVDDHILFDYNLNLNDVVQLMIMPEEAEVNVEKKPEEKGSSSSSTKTEVEAESEYFKKGDLVDVLDVSLGAWIEGVVTLISKNESIEKDKLNEYGDNLLYHVKLNGDEIFAETLNNVRPRARHVYQYSDLKIGDTVLANYNMDDPEERGLWYDCVITRLRGKNVGRRSKHVVATLYFGGNKSPLKDVKLQFCDDIMKIEERQLLSCRKDDMPVDIPKRKTAPFCSECDDDPEKDCRECGCSVCSGKDDPDKLLMCDECNKGYHLNCLNPPLETVPSEEYWYCPECKNDENEIVRAGEKLKESKKKAQMASRINNTKRDWGKGMACVGRTKQCTLVPPNHHGPIPGVEVGTCWMFRLQASEAGVHRPHVAGIHGRESDGAYSIVLSGGYEDDVDNGESFLYTGSGGRDLSGNKRTAGQSCDQTLTRMNKALATNCNAPLSERGAEAKNWRSGKPIRVVRNYKLAKHSKYAPTEGNRYDGIYKVVKYYPEKGKSGFLVWRYLLRRDDPTPAPWTTAGKLHCDTLGLKMNYPEGYLEALSEKDKENSDQKKGKKRVLQEQALEPNSKRMKCETFILGADVKSDIENDKDNEKHWDTCRESLKDGRQKFLEIVREVFMCICCQELVHNPVTTSCKHNICCACLKRSFSAEVYTCPYCRNNLGNKYPLTVNEYLSKALLTLIPGYDAGR